MISAALCNWAQLQFTGLFLLPSFFSHFSYIELLWRHHPLQMLFVLAVCAYVSASVHFLSNTSLQVWGLDFWLFEFCLLTLFLSNVFNLTSLLTWQLFDNIAKWIMHILKNKSTSFFRRFMLEIIEVKETLESYEHGLIHFKWRPVNTDHRQFGEQYVSPETALERWPPHNVQKPDCVVYLKLFLTDGARWMNFTLNCMFFPPWPACPSFFMLL